jgi:CRISPR-associated protein Csc1
LTGRHDLNAHGVRLYAVRLYNHDYLWFSSFEIAKTSATEPVIHNYALSYSLSARSYGIYSGHVPNYASDLAEMAAYATPARPEEAVTWTRFTQNAINSRTLRTDDAPRGINSPALGWRVVLNPLWRRTRVAAGGGFSCYVFARAGFRPSSVTRLGKKGCPVRLEWEEIASPVATLATDVVRPTHAVNPLDVQGQVKAYEPVLIPPHLILRVVEIENDWFVFSGKHKIHLPRRFAPAIAPPPREGTGNRHDPTQEDAHLGAWPEGMIRRT